MIRVNIDGKSCLVQLKHKGQLLIANCFVVIRGKVWVLVQRLLMRDKCQGTTLVVPLRREKDWALAPAVLFHIHRRLASPEWGGIIEPTA